MTWTVHWYSEDFGDGEQEFEDHAEAQAFIDHIIGPLESVTITGPGYDDELEAEEGGDADSDDIGGGSSCQDCGDPVESSETVFGGQLLCNDCAMSWLE